MARSNRIPRPLPDLLKALDHHQYLLRDALYGLLEDPAHIKTLATELRTLVCLSSGTEGLLWRLADELNVSDVIELDAVKAVDRSHPLAIKLAIAIVPLRRPERTPRPKPTRTHRLRDSIKQYEAIYVAQVPDRIFTHELLIGAIAGQMGGAHEAEGLDPALTDLGKLHINNRELYFQTLAFDAVSRSSRSDQR